MTEQEVKKKLNELNLNFSYYRQKRYGRGRESVDNPKPREPMEDFLKRCVRQLPYVLRRTHGVMPLVAGCFDISEDEMRDILAKNKDVLQPAMRECLVRCTDEERPHLKAISEIVEGDYTPPEPKQRATAKDGPPGKKPPVTRTNWPKDQRVKDQLAVELIGEALLDYGADLEDVAEAINLPMHEVLAYIAAEPTLQRAESVGLAAQAGYARSAMLKKAREGNIQAAKEVLKALDESGLWADRQHVHHHGASMAPPPETKSEGSSVLDGKMARN